MSHFLVTTFFRIFFSSFLTSQIERERWAEFDFNYFTKRKNCVTGLTYDKTRHFSMHHTFYSYPRSSTFIQLLPKLFSATLFAMREGRRFSFSPMTQGSFRTFLVSFCSLFAALNRV